MQKDGSSRDLFNLLIKLGDLLHDWLLGTVVELVSHRINGL